jgi:hypothetical protein
MKLCNFGDTEKTMQEDISYYIPVKSHVKKYLSHHVAVDPFKVSINNQFGILLFMSLSFKQWIPNEERLSYNDRMLIEIPNYHSSKQGPFISNRKIELFNDMVEKMMKWELFLKLNLCNHKKGDIKRVIENFRDMYNITDCEMEYHNLRKAYNRERGICK